jgi:hypothetical protein
MGRLFGFLSIVIVLAAGMYIYSRQVQSTSAGTGNPKAAVNITGVKMDLMAFANAERRYYATEGKYASLDELVSGDYVSTARQRPPYSYEVQTSSSGFRVIANRSGDDTSGAPAQFSVDESMQIQQSQ